MGSAGLGKGETAPREQESWEGTGAGEQSLLRPATCRARGRERGERRARAGLGSRPAVQRREKAPGRKAQAGLLGEERPPGPRARPSWGGSAAGSAAEPGLCWELSGLLETRRIRFQINEIWVHTFTLLLPALMLF